MASKRKQSLPSKDAAGPSLVPVPERPQRTFSAGNAIELLEEQGLIDAQRAVTELEGWPYEKVQDLAGDIFDFLENQRSAWKADEDGASPFTSFASASMRGDSGCSQPQCRVAKLSVLKRYAAMYADHVYCPMPLTTSFLGEGHERVRKGLIRTVLSLLELRELVESGRVRPIVSVSHYCKECAARALAVHKQGTETVKHQAADLAKEFRFSYFKPTDFPFTVVEIEGPTDYLEHGSLARLFDKTPAWLPTPKQGGKKYKIARNTRAHATLLEDLFKRIAADVLFHRQNGLVSEAAFLTDMPGDIEFLRLLSKSDELAIRTAAVCSRLSHEIPLLMDIPVRTIMRIREDHPECFDLYRTTVRKIVREHIRDNRSTSGTEAQEIYRDLLEPALSGLRAEAKRQRTRWVKKSVGTAALALGVVSLGATGVLQPQQVMSLLGGAVIKGLVDQLAEAGTEPVTSNNLYFLLRLENERARRA